MTLFSKIEAANSFINKAKSKIHADHQKQGGRLIELLALDDALEALPSEAMTESEYNRIWDKAYNDSRGANVFNDIPSFKHALTTGLKEAGALLVREGK